MFCFVVILASTKEIILGTGNGQLYEMAVDEKDKREKYIKLLYELTELPEAFMGIQVGLFIILFFPFCLLKLLCWSYVILLLFLHWDVFTISFCENFWSQPTLETLRLTLIFFSYNIYGLKAAWRRCLSFELILRVLNFKTYIAHCKTSIWCIWFICVIWLFLDGNS